MIDSLFLLWLLATFVVLWLGVRIEIAEVFFRLRQIVVGWALFLFFFWWKLMVVISWCI